MQIAIDNCNNIDHGVVTIEPGCLNIKYAINGTGKTSVAKAIRYSISSPDSLECLRPFKSFSEGNDSHSVPSVSGLDDVSTVKVFDEEYIQQFVFVEDEVLKNSFEVFIKDDTFERHEQEINALILSVKRLFEDSDECRNLHAVLQKFSDSYKATRTGFSASGVFGKGLAKGNKLSSIPENLRIYEPFLKHANVVPWLKWQIDGEKYLDVGTCCPYCSSPKIEERKEIVRSVKEEFEPKYVEHLNAMLALLDSLSDYVSEETNEKLERIKSNVSGITEEQKTFVSAIYLEIDALQKRLEDFKHLSFKSLKDIDDVQNTLRSRKIDVDCFSKINSALVVSAINKINSEIDAILVNAGRLKGEINQQKRLISNKIRDNCSEINAFLKYAGYSYSVSICEEDEYKMLLKYADNDSLVCDGKQSLSYGEKNAFALVLFMYDAIRENPGIIILDDPISSFDQNKKYAILNKLFLENNSLKNKTVLLFTHDFGVVIDCVYNFADKFHPKASFLENLQGNLKEREIRKTNILSFKKIALLNTQSNNATVSVAYLRRLLEFEGMSNMGYQLLSNLIHKREIPMLKGLDCPRDMTQQEIDEGTAEIQKIVPTFDYALYVNELRNYAAMIALYDSLSNGYEKMQVYRMLRLKNPEPHATEDQLLINENSVVKKHVDETMHIENDYVFQLNPVEYDCVPNKIIELCDDYVREIESMLADCV